MITDFKSGLCTKIAAKLSIIVQNAEYLCRCAVCTKIDSGLISKTGFVAEARSVAIVLKVVEKCFMDL